MKAEILTTLHLTTLSKDWDFIVQIPGNNSIRNYLVMKIDSLSQIYECWILLSLFIGKKKKLIRSHISTKGNAGLKGFLQQFYTQLELTIAVAFQCLRINW